MKTHLLITALFFAVTLHAQQGPAYTGDYVDYKIETPAEKISIPFPEGTQILENGKVVANGKTFSIETTGKATYAEMSKKMDNDTLSAEVKDLFALTYFYSHSTLAKPEREIDRYYQSNYNLKYMKAPDGTFTIFWYDWPKDGTEQAGYFAKTSKVAGNSIVTLTLDEPAQYNKEEFKVAEDFMRNTLNSMHKTPVK